jgi:hypothetical protein
LAAEFDIEPTEELQIHFWKWTTENNCAGHHMLAAWPSDSLTGLVAESCVRTD